MQKDTCTEAVVRKDGLAVASAWKQAFYGACFQHRIFDAVVALDDNYNVTGVGVLDKNNYMGSHPKQMTVDSYDAISGTKNAAAALSYSHS